MKKNLDTLFLAIAGALFALFIMNIFAGKIALTLDEQPIMSLGDVGEFLVLFAAVIFFIIVVLRREIHESGAGTKIVGTEQEDIR